MAQRVEVAARFVVHTPHTAASPAALAVRDEFKSDLATIVLAGAVGPLLLCILVAGRILPEAGIATVVLFVWPVLRMENQRRRRVRDRLWTARHRPGRSAGSGGADGPLVPEPAP